MTCPFIFFHFNRLTLYVCGHAEGNEKKFDHLSLLFCLKSSFLVGSVVLCWSLAARKRKHITFLPRFDSLHRENVVRNRVSGKAQKVFSIFTLRRNVDIEKSSRSDEIIEALKLFWSFWGMAGEQELNELSSTSFSLPLTCDEQRLQVIPQRELEVQDGMHLMDGGSCSLEKKEDINFGNGSSVGNSDDVVPPQQQSESHRPHHVLDRSIHLSSLYTFFQFILRYPSYNPWRLTQRVRKYFFSRSNHYDQEVPTHSAELSFSLSVSPPPVVNSSLRSHFSSKQEMSKKKNNIFSSFFARVPLRRSVGEVSIFLPCSAVRSISKKIRPYSFSIFLKLVKKGNSTQTPPKKQGSGTAKTNPSSSVKDKMLNVSVTVNLFSSYFEPLIPSLGRCPTVVVFRVMSVEGIHKDYSMYVYNLVKQLRLDSCFTEDDLVDIICIQERETGTSSLNFLNESNEEEQCDVSFHSTSERTHFTAPLPSYISSGVPYASMSGAAGQMRIELYPARVFYLSFFLSLLLQEKNNAILSVSGEAGTITSHFTQPVGIPAHLGAVQQEWSPPLLPSEPLPARSYQTYGRGTHPAVPSKFSPLSFSSGSFSSFGQSCFSPKRNVSSQRSTGTSAYGSAGAPAAGGGKWRSLPAKILHNCHAVPCAEAGEMTGAAGADQNLGKEYGEGRKTFKKGTGNQETHDGGRGSSVAPENTLFFFKDGEEHSFLTGVGKTFFSEAMSSTGAGPQNVPLMNSVLCTLNPPLTFPNLNNMGTSLSSPTTNVLQNVSSSPALSAGHGCEIAPSPSFSTSSTSSVVVIQSMWEWHYLSKKSLGAIQAADSLLQKIRETMDESLIEYLRKKTKDKSLILRKQWGDQKFDRKTNVEDEKVSSTNSGRVAGAVSEDRMTAKTRQAALASLFSESPTNLSTHHSPSSSSLSTPHIYGCSLPHLPFLPDMENIELLTSPQEHLAEQVSSYTLSLLEDFDVFSRQQRRDAILHSAKSYMTRVCTIPLPDNRIYCDIPSSVCRFIAAHTRGFTPLGTLAEDWLHYNRYLSFLLAQKKVSHNEGDERSERNEENNGESLVKNEHHRAKKSAVIHVERYFKDSMTHLSGRKNVSESSIFSTDAEEIGGGLAEKNISEREQLHRQSSNEYFLSRYSMTERRQAVRALESQSRESPSKAAFRHSVFSQEYSSLCTSGEVVDIFPSGTSFFSGAKDMVVPVAAPPENVVTAAVHSSPTAQRSTTVTSTRHSTHRQRCGTRSASCMSESSPGRSAKERQPFDIKVGRKKRASPPFSDCALNHSLTSLRGKGGESQGGNHMFATVKTAGDATCDCCTLPPLTTVVDHTFSSSTGSYEAANRVESSVISGVALPSRTSLRGLSLPHPSQEMLFSLQGDFCYQSFVRNVDRALSRESNGGYTSEKRWKENGQCIFYVFTNPSAFLFSASAGKEVNVEDDFWLYEDELEERWQEQSGGHEEEEETEEEKEKGRKEEGRGWRQKNKKSTNKVVVPNTQCISDFSVSPLGLPKESDGKKDGPHRSFRCGPTYSVSSSTFPIAETKVKLFFQILKRIRDRRNAPLLPLFRHLHSQFFDTITRPMWTQPSSHSRTLPSASHFLQLSSKNSLGNRSMGWLSRLLNSLLLKKHFLHCLSSVHAVLDEEGVLEAEKKIRFDSSVASAPPTVVVHTKPPSPLSSSVHLEALSSVSFKESSVKCMNKHSSSSPLANSLRCLGGRMISITEVDRANGQYGLTPLEVWMCTRYSERCGAEVYMLDVAAAKGDMYIPTTRVIDEVVSHAIFVHHNCSLKEFVEDLLDHFDLQYIPKTSWGVRTLSRTFLQVRESLMQKRREDATQAFRNSIAASEKPLGGNLKTKNAFENTWDADISDVAVEYFGREHEEIDINKELEHLKLFLLHHRHLLSSAMFTPVGANKLESLFGVPSTVFPFLLCQRESISLVHSIFKSLTSSYGGLTFKHFHHFMSDVFKHDRPEVVRHAARIFRTLNRSRTGCISYEELCSWLARKLSCDSQQQPDVQLLAVLMSLRLPMALLVDRKTCWSQRGVTNLFSLEGDDEFR